LETAYIRDWRFWKHENKKEGSGGEGRSRAVREGAGERGEK
jgi:hypothetical protein